MHGPIFPRHRPKRVSRAGRAHPDPGAPSGPRPATWTAPAPARGARTPALGADTGGALAPPGKRPHRTATTRAEAPGRRARGYSPPAPFPAAFFLGAVFFAAVFLAVVFLAAVFFAAVFFAAVLRVRFGAGPLARLSASSS